MNSSLLNKILSPLLTTPASNRTCNKSNDDDGVEASASSYFQKTVCLYDWWLVEADKDYEGQRIAVGGFTSKEHQAMRVFTSAPIVKRYDVFTLETADGIIIVIKGFLNKLRTMENGFSSEVLSPFMFGFPPNWKACAEMCLGEKFVNGTGLVTCPKYNKAAAELECIKNSYSDVIARIHKVNGEIDYSAGDTSKCFVDVFENISDPLTSSDLPGHAANSNDIGNTKNCASKNLAPLMSCYVNNISSLEDNLAVLAESSSYHMTGSSGRMANSKSWWKDSTGTVTKSTTDERANLESITIMNAASGESTVPKGSNMDNTNYLSDFKPVTLALRATLCGSKSSEKNDKSKCGLNYGNKNISTVSVPQDFEAILRSTGERSSRVERPNLSNFDLGVTQEESLFMSVGGEPNILGCSEYRIDNTVSASAVQRAANVTAITPSRVDTSAVNVSSNTRNKKGSNLSLNSNQKRHSGFSASAKHISKDLKSETLSDGDNLKRCSLHQTNHSERKIGTLRTTRSQSMRKNFRNLTQNLKGKEKERVSVVCELKSNSVSLLSDETSNIVPADDLCGEPEEPSDSTAVKVNSKQGQDHEKITQAGILRQNKINSTKCPIGGDTNNNHNLDIAVGERERNVHVGSSRKARRKISYDAQASPCTPETKQKYSIVSPESLSLKRSRSGRLLVPCLDFWRNQIAVYDAERSITGIQEELDILKTSKGDKSEPPKKRNR